jgi:hypothetical protein
MSAAQTNRLAMTMRIRAELESIADSNGIFAISVPKLARRLNMSDIPVSIAFYDLIKTGELVVVRANYWDGSVQRPKTYRLITPGEMLARQAPNVIRFMPRKRTKAAYPPMPSDHLSA